MKNDFKFLHLKIASFFLFFFVLEYYIKKLILDRVYWLYTKKCEVLNNNDCKKQIISKIHTKEND